MRTVGREAGGVRAPDVHKASALKQLFDPACSRSALG